MEGSVVTLSVFSFHLAQLAKFSKIHGKMSKSKAVASDLPEGGNVNK